MSSEQTDYLILSDNTLASNMATYRQQLRDLTSGLNTVDKINNVGFSNILNY